MQKFQQHGNWHIRNGGIAVNLNSSRGADYVLELQRRIDELESKPKRRGGPRKKIGPKETK